ncbi:MAG TPA: glycoside hydrolase family 2 TIM barrel-domain containing protein [Planctomycetota bacterium]|nr:glycoside hydrolase family 2 TIM barrel-domain containing protein [Planctomycetota bacterium]
MQWDGSTILVPFAPETPASGIGETGFFQAVWYRRAFAAPALGPGERLLLHFGAVDYEATVWVEGAVVARHEGGYAPFQADITEVVRGRAEVQVVVRAFDDPADLSKPRGKQDWQAEPHSIWYPRTTGIWQTVWFEVVHETHIVELRWTPYLDKWEVGLSVHVAGADGRSLNLNVRLHARGLTLARDRYSVAAGEVHRRIALSDPGIDDFRNELLWSPGKPTLIDAELELVDDERQVLESVRSYTALRTFAVDRDRLVLNGRPYALRMVLDQGYWPESGATAPDDAALKRDVELAKEMGFNGVRKHQKIEDPRYLYWADRLGLLVWEEMPSAYRFTSHSVERLTRQWLEALRRDVSHPCIVAWVPFNESWGVPNLPDNAAERSYVQALYSLTKTIDPTRPVIGNDGWEHVATDIIGIHDYDHRPRALVERYQTPDALPSILKRERPGGRVLALGAGAGTDHPVVLSEFGGIALAPQGLVWGYSRVDDAAAFERRYTDLLRAVRSLRMLSGVCYTQFADTYQEATGLLTADRRPKFPIERIREATRPDEPPQPGGEDAMKTERTEAPP